MVIAQITIMLMKLKVMNNKLTKEEFLEKLKTDRDFNNRYGRKHITEGKMVLPPCHFSFQVYTRELSYEERALHINKPEMVEDRYFTADAENELTKMMDEDGVPTRAISLMWNQRSVDIGLGWGFNVTSYGLLLMILAKQVNMIPDELICSLGDCHIYLNHVEGLKEQIGRSSYNLPTVKISDKIVGDLADYTLDDFILENYQSHPTIKLPLSN